MTPVRGAGVGMHVHVGDRTDRLADDLATLLADPLDDPFATELVVVPAKGVERWLTQRLSHHLGVGPRGGDGVCAGVEFRHPRSLVARLTGTEGTDPWDPDRLVWPVLAAIDGSLGEPWCAALARHLGEQHTGEERELRRGRRWSVARRVAGLFATYGVQRPALLTAWSAGHDTDGLGAELPADLRWQAHVWRLVAAAVDALPPQDRHTQTLAAVRAGRDLALPSRLSLFGHTRMPVTEIELVEAVAEVREVHLWLPLPSPELWRRLRDVVVDGPVRRHADSSSVVVRHPLLSSLGRDTRELQRSLVRLGDAERVVAAAERDAPGTLLGWLQSDLHADHEAPAVERAARVVAPDDRSVQVHSAHGAARQVEVLREVLVGLLEDDPTLEPRDILVMCPDIDTYAPLFEAAFGLGGVVSDAGGGHPAHRLRLRLADRGLAHTNPLVAVAIQLVEIVGGRATLSQVLDLAGAAPVRHRFGFGDDELATLATWAEESGVRWGLDAPHRAAFGLDGFPQNTWRSGLDRLVVGVAMSEGEALVGDVLPLDDVPSAEVDLVGRLAEFVDRVETLVDGLERASGLSEWMRVLHDGVLSLGSTSARDAWQVAQFERELAAAASGAGPGGDDHPGPELRLPDLRALLEQRSAGRPTRSNFRTGALTVCTMVPMRSVPHRVVCLVGLDDGHFPRASSTDGDDVLARDPVTGERDVRSEDRQLLLDAVLAATERLVVTYTGADEVSGQVRPPAVPLGELLDALDATASVTGAATGTGVGVTVASSSSSPPAVAGRVSDHVLVRHPLQPHDPLNLVPGALAAGHPFSFDRAALAGARAAAALTAHDDGDDRGAGSRRRRRGRPLVPDLLPAAPTRDLTLRQLQDFFAHPAKAFLRQRLDIAVPFDVDEADDAIPIELDALQEWAIGDRLLRRLLDGVPPDAVFDAELRRGDLPPGDLAGPLFTKVGTRASSIATATRGWRETAARSVDVAVDLAGNVAVDLAGNVAVDLAGGRRLTGTVAGVRGDRLLRVTYSSLGPKPRLAAWIDLVALSVAHPGTSWSAVTVGWKGGRDKVPQASYLRPVDPVEAGGVLAELVDLYDRGMREPLPLATRTSHAWAEAAHRRRPPEWPARQAWETDRNAPVPGEQDDAAHVLVHGAGLPFAELKNAGSVAESWNDESSRLGQIAVRLWSPVFAHERTELL